MASAHRPSWPPQPGQREKSFQPEQDSGKVFRGHRCGDGVDGTGVEGGVPWPGVIVLTSRRPVHSQDPGDLPVGILHLSIGTR